jgi:hypothetical protein
MSYDYDADGNKTFYEQGLKDENERVELDFNNWYNLNSVELQEEYFERNPDEIKTDEDMQDIENNGNFQSFCEREYDKYLEEF